MAKRQRVLEVAKNGCYLNIEASPDASKTEFLGVDPWRGAIRIAVESAPVSGKANAALIDLLEAAFPEARGSIVIARGGKSRSKRIFIPLDAGTIRERLGLKDD